MKYWPPIMLIMVFSALKLECTGRSFFNPRPQEFGVGRDMLHALEYYHDGCLSTDDDPCRRCGTFSVAGVYEQLFHANHQADYFFGTDTLTFSGSLAPSRNSTCDILADYFGLPTDFQSVVNFSPSVKTAMADIRYTMYTRMWGRRWFVQAYAPVVWTRWDMGMTECCCQNTCSPGTLNYPAGYMSTGLIERSALPINVTQAFQGTVSFGDFQPLKYGKLCGSRTATALADITFMGGFFLVDAIDNFFAMHLRVVAPTGTRSDARYLFEPVIGNGYAWELGGGFSGYANLWHDDDERHIFHLYGDATISHLFNSWQKRSYDFKLNGPLSRYMLIEEIGPSTTQGLMVNGLSATLQYRGAIMPAINQTTLDSLISIGAQAEMSIKVVYEHHKRCSLEVGYTLWARTQEHLRKRQHFACNQFAIKGDAQVYGQAILGTQFVALNGTEHGATIHAAQGTGSVSNEFTNPNVDTPGLAIFLAPLGQAQPVTLLQSTLAGSINTGINQLSQVNGSVNPLTIQDSDLDNFSGLHPMAFSNTLFMNAYHRWLPGHDTQPFMGVGGKVEVDGTNKKRRSAQSLWSVWLEGGVSF